MSRNLPAVEQLLSSGSPNVRDLHSIWEQRQPIPEPGHTKSGYSAGSDVPRIAWMEDLRQVRKFTTHALRREEFLLVLDAAREILRLWAGASSEQRSNLLWVRMDYASALTRLGFTRDARRELEPYLAPGYEHLMGAKLRGDILLQLGHILREESQHAQTKATQYRTIEDALGFYRRALDLDPERLEALSLAASTAFILGDADAAVRAQSQSAAEAILRLSKDLAPGHETISAQAVAYAVLGKIDEASRSYERLAAVPEITTAELAEARFQAQFLAEALGKSRNLFHAAFPPLQLIVFAGHLPDRPPDGSEAPVRFPPESIPAARDALRKKLKEMRARVGLVSASAGADLLFIEALQEMQGSIHLVLPWSQEEFRRTSVQPYESGATKLWEPLFDRALLAAATTREIGQVYEPSSDVGWEYMMEVTAGIALHTARASRLDIQPMVLWDGLPGNGAGGTSSFHSFWKHELRIDPCVVKLPPQPAESPGAAEFRNRPCERAILHQEVKSMLFADIVGYSKLTEKVIPEFIGTFLDRLSQLTARSKHAPCSVNTWGDAIYAVFDFAKDAGLYALELAQMIQEGSEEWLKKGLYWEERNAAGEVSKHPLNIRIGLHTGPVVMHYDPVVRRLGFTGAHVNRAARIEPITKPGEVFASEEFAAMAELSAEIRRRKADGGDSGSTAFTVQPFAPAPGLGFVCEYAGSMQLAKGYPGRYSIYRVVPQRVFALECLARAAHEAYCEESKARGDTPATNSSLRPWEALTEDLREANRAQVADIPNKLRLLGFELAPSHGIPPTQLAITDAQVEQLANLEHERWMAERQRQGWTFGAKRDDARKHHPLIVPWDRLAEPEKDKDRDTIRNLPRLVEKAGFRLRQIG